MSLSPRKHPTQQRAKDTVDRILNTTAILVEERGIDALSTNLIAEESGVTVGSIYQYFPNKHAILAALAERMLTAENRYLSGQAVDGNLSARTWQEALDLVIDGLLSGRRTQPGGPALRRALAAIPELTQVREADRETVVLGLIPIFRRFGATISDEQLRLVVEATFDTADALLDRALLSDPEHIDQLIAETKLVLRSYLLNYLRP